MSFECVDRALSYGVPAVAGDPAAGLALAAELPEANMRMRERTAGLVLRWLYRLGNGAVIHCPSHVGCMPLACATRPLDNSAQVLVRA